VNLLITYFLLIYADKIVERVGEATSRGTAKVVGIFLAAIGIMMIRKGVEAIFIK
jgi:small neutral amino acid transporter SnatA (MarC family)